MPTYSCVTAPGKLTPAQKDEIARVCTDIYHEEFGVARYLVQVIFREIASEDRYIAGKTAQPDVVWIRCDVREGRTGEQKSRLLRRVQQGVAKTADVPEEAVWIYLCDLPPTNIMVWGHIIPPLVRGMPGDDDTWFRALSGPLQASLRPFA